MRTEAAVEALESGLSSPFWALLCAYLDQEWGAGGRRFEAAITAVADQQSEDKVLVDQIRQIAVARREILRLTRWPHEELARLKAQASAPPPQGAPAMTPQDESREAMLTVMGRRGGF